MIMKKLFSSNLYLHQNTVNAEELEIKEDKMV